MKMIFKKEVDPHMIVWLGSVSMFQPYNGDFDELVFLLPYVGSLRFFVPLEIFSIISRRTAKVNLHSALMVIEQWHGISIYLAFSEDPWHSHLLLSFW